MSRNGSGTYSLPEAAFVYDTVIDETAVNNNFSDIATALSDSLAKDGQTDPTANLPMATFRHTGVGNATARTHYAATGQVQDGAFTWCGTAGGTANALTITPSPAIADYAAGQRFVFKSGASPSDDAVTLAVSGLAAKDVQINDAALSANVVLGAGKYFEALYDGTQFQITRLSEPSAFPVDPNADRIVFWDDSVGAIAYLTVGAGLSLSGTTLTATGPGPTVTQYTSGSGTYTVPAGVRALEVRMVGGGGGGGGAVGAGSNGVATTFGGVTAAAGSGGPAPGNAYGGVGGSGGSGTLGTTMRFDGERGDGISNQFSNEPGGGGGGSAFFGGGGAVPAGYGNAGVAGATNSGGGGSGASVSGGTGSAGAGAGESVEIVITSPAASYSYAVGTGGSGGSGSPAGGAGAAGRIIIKEYY